MRTPLAWLPILLLPLLPTGASAAEDVEKETSNVISEAKLDRGLGVALGAIGGTGFSFRLGLSDAWTLQLAGIVWANRSEVASDVGFSLIRELRRYAKSRLYVPVGAGIYFGDDRTVFAGAGLGIEFLFKGGLSGLSLELPMVLSLDTNSGVDFAGLYPIPSVAFHIYF